MYVWQWLQRHAANQKDVVAGWMNAGCQAGMLMSEWAHALRAACDLAQCTRQLCRRWSVMMSSAVRTPFRVEVVPLNSAKY